MKAEKWYKHKGGKFAYVKHIIYSSGDHPPFASVTAHPEGTHHFIPEDKWHLFEEVTGNELHALESSIL